MSEFWSAIAGALVGGGIAAFVQWLTLRHVGMERDRGLAYSLLFKVSTIYSQLRNMRKMIEGAIEAATPDERTNLWNVVRGSVNLPDRVDFSAEEIALVLRHDPGETLDDLLMLDAKHNATLSAYGFYSDKRVQLTESLVVIELDGVQAIAELTLQQKAIAASLDELIDGLRKYLAEDVGQAINVLQQVVGLFEKPLSIKYTALPKPDAPKPAVTAATAPTAS